MGILNTQTTNNHCYSPVRREFGLDFRKYLAYLVDRVPETKLSNDPAIHFEWVFRFC
jgi:hypothetical protein